MLKPSQGEDTNIYSTKKDIYIRNLKEGCPHPLHQNKGYQHPLIQGRIPTSAHSRKDINIHSFKEGYRHPFIQERISTSTSKDIYVHHNKGVPGYAHDVDYPKSTRPFKGFPTSLSSIKETRSRVNSFVAKTSATCKGEMEASTRNLGHDRVPYQEKELLYMGKLGRSFYPPYAHSRMRPHSQTKGRILCHDIAKEKEQFGHTSTTDFDHEIYA